MISYGHYFDWAATSPMDEGIAREALDYAIEHWANPSSLHEAGKDARKALEEQRAKAAKALGIKPEQFFFTSGGTEGDHLALLSVLMRPQKGSVILSAIEHPALREMTSSLKNCGWNVITVNPDKNGIITCESIAEKLQDDTVLVSVMWVNNETGAVQPVEKIASLLEEKCKGKRKPLFHVDAVQATGKIPMNLANCGADSVSISAHKISGPRGIGGLYLANASSFNGFLRGGGQEKNVRSGTENLFGAAAFASCLEKYFISEKNICAKERFKAQKKFTSDFIKELLLIKGASIIPHCRNGENEELFSPWVVQASFPGIPGQVMERALSADGFFISTGSACSQGSHARPVLDTMGISGKEKEAAVRFSFGHETTESSMKELLEEVKKVCKDFL